MNGSMYDDGIGGGNNDQILICGQVPTNQILINL